MPTYFKLFLSSSIKRIINEPITTILSYCMNEEGLVNVFEFVGGTFNVLVLEISKCVFEIKASNGDSFFDGKDFDNTLL